MTDLLVEHPHACEWRVRLREGLVHVERLLRRCLRLGVDFFGREIEERQHLVRRGHTGEGLSVRRIAVLGSFEVANPLLEPLSRLRVQMVEALQVQCVRLETPPPFRLISCCSVDSSFTRRAFATRWAMSPWTAKMLILGPEVYLVVRVDELGADPHPVPRLSHAAFEDGPRVQLAANLGDFLGRALVRHHGCARDNL